MTSAKFKTSRLPDFLCIGAQKAGTSWLDVNLRDHPDVWMPPIKELHFFDHLFVDSVRNWTANHIRKKVDEVIKNRILSKEPIDEEYKKYLSDIATRDLFTEPWYRRIFANPEIAHKTLGEITPEYSTIPQEGIQYLKAFLNNPKIIYIIRDPIARATSQIRMNLHKRHGSTTDQIALELSNDDWLAQVSNWDVQHRGRYSEYVPAWCEQFSEENLLFLPYKRISKEPNELLNEVERFLGLEPHGNYPRAARRIYAGHKVVLPEFVLDAIVKSMSREVMFLESHFGRDFFNLT